MSNLTISWILLTIPIGVLFISMMYTEDLKEKDKWKYYLTCFIFMSLLWWGTYFLIK